MRFSFKIGKTRFSFGKRTTISTGIGPFRISQSFGGRTRKRRSTRTTRSSQVNAQVPPRPATKLRKSNSSAIIALVIAVMVFPIVGISLSWNATFISWFIRFSIVSFIVYMIVNNVKQLRQLFLKLWVSNKLLTGIGIAIVTVIIAIITAVA